MKATSRILLLPFAAWLAAGFALAMPAHIVITVPSGAQGGSTLPVLLAEWRQTGLIADAFLLKNVQSKESGFTSVAVLQFPDEAAVERWQTKGAPAIGQGLIAIRVDTLARGE